MGKRNTINIFAILVLCLVLGANAEVTGFCRPNEMYLTCGGCQKTCLDPAPACTSQCRVGCYCPEDLVRGPDGICMPLAKCPTDISTSNETEVASSEYSFDFNCSKDEEFSWCQPCGNRTCDKPYPICPAQCARGCFCKDDLVRNSEGKCVLLDQCDNLEESKTASVEISKCGSKQQLAECACEKSCSKPSPVCTAECRKGCVCNEGLVRAPDGQCVPLEDCPKEDCFDSNAEYTCRYPCEEFCSGKPCSIRAHKCSVACFCRPGFIKEDSNGKCVLPYRCLTKRKTFN